MYAKMISKMTNHFSEVGCIFYSKACDHSGIYEITKDDILMYYKLLKSEELHLPEKISKNNHLACCLFYLAKEGENYKEEFLDKYLRNVSFNNLGINEANLIFIFNIIEFDKVYLNSPKDHIEFLYQLLKSFSNYPTNFQYYLLYKYYRGYLKFKIGEPENSNKEYFEIISEMAENKNPNFLVKYIRLNNDLLKVNLYHLNKKRTRADYNEYWQFLRGLFDEVKTTNKILAIKLGFDLFSSYFEGQNYNDCIPLLVEMKQLLKKQLLKGSTMQNGIDYYLAIASRLGYIGILLDNQKAINSAISKIRRTLDIIKNDKNNDKLVKIVKAYTFVLAILEIGLTKKTEFNLLLLSSDFQNTFFPNIGNNNFSSYIINEQNKDSILINFKIINNMNDAITKEAKLTLSKCASDLQSNNFSNPKFLIFILAVHDKINRYSEAFITDTNEKMRVYYKSKIIDYHDGAMSIVNSIIENGSDDSILFKSRYIKIVIIDIFFAYAQIFVYEKNMDKLRTAILDFDRLRKKINIEDNIPAFALVNKIKGDNWFYLKYYKEAINYYENALGLFEKNNPKVPPVLFNCGCAYYFYGNKKKAKEYLNKCISEYSNIILEKNCYGFTPDRESINNKIKLAKNLVNQLG